MSFKIIYTFVHIYIFKQPIFEYFHIQMIKTLSMLHDHKNHSQKTSDKIEITII